MYWVIKRLYFAFSCSVLTLLFTNGDRQRVQRRMLDMFHKKTVSTRPAQEIWRCIGEECRAGKANVLTRCREWATIWKTTIVTASQVGDRLVRMNYCYFHQTATLNMCVFLFLLLFSQKSDVTIVFSVKFSIRIIFYLNFKKNWLLLFSQCTLQFHKNTSDYCYFFSEVEWMT